MQEADYSNSILICKIHPIIARFESKLSEIRYTIVLLEDILKKTVWPRHPYCIVMADVLKLIDRLSDTLSIYRKEPEMPTNAGARKQAIKQMRDRFFWDLMWETEFTPREIAEATSVSAGFLEKLRMKGV